MNNISHLLRKQSDPFVISAISLWLLVIIMLACVGFSQLGCTASLSRMSPGTQKVFMYGADGHKIGQWTAKGRVLSEDGSDGWYFTDADSGRLVIVAGGALVIEGGH